MFRSRRNQGFSLIEILLVLAILGIIAGIAIPVYLGQRRRARVIGDAIANAQVMRMQLERRKADNGIYGPTGSTFTWNGSGTPSNSTFLPEFTPKGNSKMTYSITINNNGLGYEITCVDPIVGQNAFRTNQNGETLERLQ